jgi:hypothetical protein
MIVKADSGRIKMRDEAGYYSISMSRIEAAELVREIIYACAMAGDISDSPFKLQDKIEDYIKFLKKEE